MMRRYLIMLVVTAAVLGSIFGWKFWSGAQARQAMASMQLPPATVSTAVARESDWQPMLPAIGSLRALRGVDVTAQLAAQVTELHFVSGQTVAAGDLLVRQYTAADEARLQGLRAETQLAEANLKRAEELVTNNLISATDYDTRRTELQRARAAEASLRLVIEQKTIRAPFAGRLGIRQVDVGQYVEPGDAIVRLESLKQMRVEFPVPQKYLGQVSVGQGITVHSDAWPEQMFAGKLTAVDPQVDRDTRTLRLQAVIDNAGERLLPGMFVQVQVELRAQEKVLTVPQSAISYSPYGDSVYVVSAPEGESAGADVTAVVTSAFVKTGATRGDQVAIVSGLRAGDIVVTAGQQKLRNGARVRVDNSVLVSDAADPSPANN